MSYHAGDEPIRGYTLVRSLGCGSCGEVWQAAHVSGITAAIKTIRLPDKDTGQWLPVILEMKSIRHPNAMEINRTWLRDPQGNLFGLTQARPLPGWELFIVMEVAAKSLWDRLQESLEGEPPGIERPELMTHMHAAAKGIDYLNCHGIIHGAIKPQNLLLHESKLKVSDAGHAGLIANDPLEADQAVVNSCAYASAEALRRELHQSSDQYALAVSFYQLRTGKLPFRNAASATEIRADIIAGRLFPGELPEREQEVFEKATLLDPSQRFPSAAKFIESLQLAQANAPLRWSKGAYHRPIK